MDDVKALSIEELAAFRSQLNKWDFESHGAHMEREFVFEDFVKAFAFMTQVAALAHEQDHHPNWSNVYKRVHIRLFTHDCSGLTTKDIRLAKAIDLVFDKSM